MSKFKYYVKLYIPKNTWMPNKINSYISHEFLKKLRRDFYYGNYNKIPFEISLGLLNFICKAQKVCFIEIMKILGKNSIINNKALQDSVIGEICPIEYLKALSGRLKGE